MGPGEVVLNAVGELIQSEWVNLADRFPSVVLDEFIIMPNHFHAILFLLETEEWAATDHQNDDAAPTSDEIDFVGAGLVPARGRSGNSESEVGEEREEATLQERAATRAAPTSDGVDFVRAGLVPPRKQPVIRNAPTLSAIIGAFKSITTVRYIENVKTKGWLPLDRQLWQRSFHDRIIRDEKELHRLREYVHFNAAKWPQDEENPANVQL